MSSLSDLSRALLLISVIASGCSLYPESPPLVEGSAGGSSATGGTGGTGSGGTGGSAGSAQGGSAGACTNPQLLELEASADTFLASNQPTTAQGADDLLEIAPNGSRRALVRFTLPQGISSEGVIQSATLQLTVVENKDFEETLVAHRLDRSWDESTASWADSEEGVTWSAAGGDFEILGSAATMVALSVAAGDSVTLDLTEDVRSFLANGSNQGWLLKVTDQMGQNSDRLRFASREATRAADRPKLIVSHCQ